MVAANNLNRYPMRGAWVNVFFVSLFFLASALNFRLRPAGAEIHVGGAELAVSPYDFVILFSFFIFSVWRSVKFDFLCLAIFAMMFCSLISFFSAVHPEYVFYEVFRGFKFFLLFLFLRSVFIDERVFAALPLIVAFIVFFEFFYSCYQYFFLSSGVTDDATSVKNLFVENGVVRVSGTLRHPALLSFYVVLLIPLLILGGLVKSRFFYFLAILSAFVCVGLTFSRTQMVLSLFSVFLCFCFFRRDSGGRLILGWAPFAIFVLGFIIVMAAVFINLELIVDRFLNAPQSSFTTRVLLAEIALRMIAENPIVGLNSTHKCNAHPCINFVRRLPAQAFSRA